MARLATRSIRPRRGRDRATFGSDGLDAQSTAEGTRAADFTLATGLRGDPLSNLLVQGGISTLGVGLGVLDHVVEATKHSCTAIDDALKGFLASMFSSMTSEVLTASKDHAAVAKAGALEKFTLMCLGILGVIVMIVVVGVSVHFGGAVKVVVGVEGEGGDWAGLFTAVATCCGVDVIADDVCAAASVVVVGRVSVSVCVWMMRQWVLVMLLVLLVWVAIHDKGRLCVWRGEEVI